MKPRCLPQTSAKGVEQHVATICSRVTTVSCYENRTRFRRSANQAHFRLRIYAMTSRRSSGFMFGISRCDMSKAAVKAMLVIPGVAAIRGNGGASLLGETR